MQKENAALHAACATENAACVKSLLEGVHVGVKRRLKRKEVKSCRGVWQRHFQRGKGEL